LICRFFVAQTLKVLNCLWRGMEGFDPASKGLSHAEAESRLVEFGPNRTLESEKISFLGIAREEITEPMILLLLFVGIMYTIFGNLQDALTIFAIIFVLVFVEIWNEYRAKKAITALSELAAPKTRVVRDDNIVEIETESVVPGDVLVFSQGTRVAADCRLGVSLSVQVDESVLTGESFPKEKKNGDNVFAGTLVISGEGKGEAYATGKNTKFGEISALAQRIKPPRTPLQLAMKSLSKTLAWAAIFFSVLIPFMGLLRYGAKDIIQLVLTGLALAFAAVPEELPIIITMILGIGSYRLSHRGFLVKKLKATETLGDATVILTDKTGTITENKMQVALIYPEDGKNRTVRAAVGVLTEMSLSPTDKAILEKATELSIKSTGAILRERGFEGNRRTKAVLRAQDDNIWLSIIGAPEEILAAFGDRHAVEEVLTGETSKGRRVIAVAEKSVRTEDVNASFSTLESALDFVGLISLDDPPRQGVRETVETAERAGIRTIMVTGDHPLTAAYIAERVGVPSKRVVTGEELNGLSDEELRKTVSEVSVFARTTPEHKYRLVNALHANNEVVAVTGDGVNDTLALKAADVGIAMGVKGTDAAREAADVVLTDDNFVTLGQAVFEGRKFFDNLRKGLKYYLSVKAALISIFLLPLALGVALPFAPIQIIVLELFMDLAASAGFVSEPAERSIYSRKPRNPKAKFPDSRMIIEIAVSAASLFAAVMISYFYASWQNLSVIETQTFAFSAWIMGHIILAFVSRSEKEPLLTLGPFSNRVMDIWAVLAFSFLLVAVSVPSLGSQLKLSTLTPTQFGLIFIIAFFAIFWREIAKFLLSRKT
jgi:Ca2+-transporting ATPase